MMFFESDHVGLWDDKQGEVSAGKSYSDNDEWDGGDMVVIVLTACPVGLRGDLTRWLLEIAPGVFVGHIDARMR